MANYLLIGAGFSRNWGGWLASEAFEYLLGCPEIAHDHSVRQLLWRHQSEGGFESALAELQTSYSSNPCINKAPLAALESAIMRMFNDMNNAFMEIDNWEFQQNRERQVGSFLTRFDAIFSLNQDLFLEHHYINDNIALNSNNRWNGAQFPGMRRIPGEEAFNSASWARSTWQPENEESFKVGSNSQPIFKLHGSSNWRRVDGNSLLIMGGTKVRDIGLTPILHWYAQQFKDRLCNQSSRLMVVGYGFRDQHINDVIGKAVDHGLKIFIIAPEGAELAHQINETHKRVSIVVRKPLKALLEKSLIGASRRALREIFCGDTAEYRKVMRFFEN